MPKITINANARSLAHKTGIDKLGQEKLAKLDRNGDGKVTLTDVRELASKAHLDKDGSLSRDDRKAIDKVLGGRSHGTGVSRGGSSESSRRGGSSESSRGGSSESSRGGRVVRGSHNLRGGSSESVVVRPSRGGGSESGGISWGGGGGSWGGGGE